MGLNNKRKQNLLVAVMISGIIVFALTAFFMNSGKLCGFDNSIRFWVYEHRTDALNKFFTLVTYMGNWQFIVAVIASLLIYSKTRRKIGIPFALASAASTLIYKLIKLSFQRPRPDIMYHLINQGGFSFPSGHSMNGLVCYGILIYLIRKNCSEKKFANIITAALSILIVLIGISRVYVGVHYPTDIIGGWSIGASALAAAIFINEKKEEK